MEVFPGLLCGGFPRFTKDKRNPTTHACNMVNEIGKLCRSVCVCVLWRKAIV